MASVGLCTRPARCLAPALQHPELPQLLRRWLGTQASSLLPGTEFTLSREFGAAEVAAFTSMTGDSNPIHSEQRQQGAEASPHPAAVLPGMLSASLFPAVIGSSFPGALYLKQTLRFVRPAQVRLRLGRARELRSRRRRLLREARSRRPGGHAAHHPQVGERLTATVTVQRASGRRVSFLTVCRRGSGGGGGEVVVEGEALALLQLQQS